MNDFFSMLGLAFKAGFVIYGRDSINKEVRAGKAAFIIIAVDGGHDGRKKYSQLASIYEVRIVEKLTKDELGHAIGKKPQAALAIMRGGMADKLLKDLEVGCQTGKDLLNGGLR